MGGSGFLVIRADLEKAICDGLYGLGILNPGHKPKITFHSSSLNEIYLATVPHHSFGVKVITNKEMAETEKESLEQLFRIGVRVPECYGTIQAESFWLLVMDYVEPGSASGGREDLIRSLKLLYRKDSNSWGWQRNNFIGTLSQKNRWYSTFENFFWESRLSTQLDLAFSRELIAGKDVENVKYVFQKFTEEWSLNQSSPRLIHGDLWSGNILTGKNGHSYLIDPSISFSHPEQDLAMLNLFGSFLNLEEMQQILASCGIEDPEHFKDRIPFWQMYPILVHINLFGSSYLSSLRQILRYYGKS
ncbi:fructosamine kinase [Leptospira santarosai str. HAI1380]|uniref:Fructosamine kinase n=1 Tax=Leptospira santarosai serovar Arenal str. MAVJ 401 TaxID=1049976 RepID=M6JK40_9LEPT|nr:Fructosamine kinase [Leptospira santarosai]EKO78358.1 fructosamine kinase [Leptospira sp. Fiocruz LV3954]EMI62030.1 fructosamine kinase [Leptospira sp. Fiocruz LV4135]EMN19993.1 fructosamine kinase [Leptospira santarosai serovar Arenal str. MAVJ 401]EMO32070.1 fructosamine kinase [Leptospira santarosai str. HAI821]EMP03646.1 fructosamine kinase [Leptospira santarosai str. HAI1380]